MAKCGIINTDLCDAIGIKDTCYIAEIYWKEIYILHLKNKVRFTTVNKFQKVYRDLSIQIDENVSLNDILKAVGEVKNQLLKNITLFDIYRDKKQLKDQKDVSQDIELLASQVERCNEILKRLSLNPDQEDEFIDEDLSMREYLRQIISSFKETSKKEFSLNLEQDLNSKKIYKSIEIVYGLRNFIGNANKFCKNKVFITLKSDSNFTEITIEDDGDGYPNDILSKIGEPYLKSSDTNSGLGLGLFIGKTLLEKNFATVNCWNSQTRSGAEVTIKWRNKDLFNL